MELQAMWQRQLQLIGFSLEIGHAITRLLPQVFDQAQTSIGNFCIPL